MRNNLPTNNKYVLELIKRRSKVPEKNMPGERALNFDQWKKVLMLKRCILPLLTK